MLGMSWTSGIQIGGGGSFFDTDWPSALNRPQYNSGTNQLTWVGPLGGGANNGSPVQQTVTLINTPGGIATTGPNQVISGLNVTAGEIQILHSGCTVKQCRIFDPHDQWYGSVIISAVVTGLTVEDCLLDGGKTSLCGIGSDGSVTSGLTPTTTNIYRRNYLTGYENHMTLSGPTGLKGVNITDNYFTACGNSDNTLFDGDMIELYNCNNILVQHNQFDGTGSQVFTNAFNSMINVSNFGANNITVNNNLFSNVSTINSFILCQGPDFGGGAANWSWTNNGYYNPGLTNSLPISQQQGGSTHVTWMRHPLASPYTITANSGNYYSATPTGTTGPLIDGTGQIS